MDKMSIAETMRQRYVGSRSCLYMGKKGSMENKESRNRTGTGARTGNRITGTCTCITSEIL